MKQLHTIQEMQSAASHHKPAVFLWSAKWCPDCVWLDPYLDMIENNNPEFDFYKLDRDELLDAAIEQEILGIPSFTVFQDGKETGRFVSKLRKTPEEVQAFLDTQKKGNSCQN